MRYLRHSSNDLSEVLDHVQEFLSRAFRGSVPRALDPRLNTLQRAQNQTGGGGGGAVSGGGGGGSAILGGDVTGSPVDNQVALLQGVTLTLTSPVTGDVLTFSGSAIVNSKTIAGAITVTGVLTASAAGNSLGATTLTGDLTLSTHDVVTDAATGTKLGTASTQKLALWGATPVAQQTLTGVKSGGTALTNLISLLATLGILVDTTT